MQSWERMILKWWVEEELPVKRAINKWSEKEEIRKGGVIERVVRRDSKWRKLSTGSMQH